MSSCSTCRCCCSAGKDRTGVIAAIVLASLGVSDDDIADDYATSAAAVDQLIEWMRAKGPGAAAASAAPPAAH